MAYTIFIATTNSSLRPPALRLRINIGPPLLTARMDNHDPLKDLFRIPEAADAVRPAFSFAPPIQPPPVPAAPKLLRPGVLIALIALAVGIFFRVAYLGAKPLHHDESLFAYYGYYLFRGWGYNYQPILHGPVLQYLSAICFFLFGDNNFTMRLPALVGGIMIFPVVWMWRRYIGRIGMLAAILLTALSPSIVYYTRFLRNDVPFLVVTMACAYCLLRLFETGGRRWAFWGVMLAALGFSMMESSIFFFAACFAFLVVAVLVDFLAGVGKPVDDLTAFPGDAVFFAPRTADGDGRRWVLRLAVAALWAVIGTALLLYFYVRIFSFSLPIDAKLAQMLPGDLKGVLAPARVLLGVLLFVPVLAVAWVAATNWRRPRGRMGVFHYFLHVMWMNRWVLLAAVAVSVAMYATFFTTFFTHMSAPDFEGNVRRLTPVQIYKNTWDYWWDQHKLHRIKGPFHYYLPLLLNYELPALLVVLAGWACSLFSGPRRLVHFFTMALTQAVALLAYLLVDSALRRNGGEGINWAYMDPKFHVTGPAHIFLALFYVQMLTHAAAAFFVRRHFVESFLTFWTVTMLFAYSYAGEKVPWLSVHVTGPLCLLAGLYIGRWLHPQWPGWASRPRRAMLYVVVALVCLWQVRNVNFVTLIHPTSPAERIVYNHTSPDMEVAVGIIEDIAMKTNAGRRLPMLIKGEAEWPLYWYLRDWPNAFPGTSDNAETTSRPVVLVNWDASFVPNLMENYTIRRLKVREWWEPPLLDFGAMAQAFRLLTPLESRKASSPNAVRLEKSLLEWRKLWHYIAYREIWVASGDGGFSNSNNDFAVSVRKDLDELYMNRQWLGSIPKRPDVPVYPEPIIKFPAVSGTVE